MHRGADWGWTLDLKPDPDDPDSPGDIGPLSFGLAKLAENDDLAGEDIRKLYVAITRHRDHLVLIGANMRNKDDKILADKSPLAQIDSVLGLVSAIDAGAETISYAGGRFQARVACVTPDPAAKQSGHDTPGRKALSIAAGPEDLAAAMIKSKSSIAPPPLIGPLPASIGSLEVAVTALNDFAHCPMLYRWRHELAAPCSQASGKPSAGGASLDALTLGTMYHRCMELLDFTNPQANKSLISQAVWEMDLDDAADIDSLSAELDDMVSRLAKHDLWGQLASARKTYRELDFVLTAGQLTLRGQIDLLYCDANDAWHVVDYKSDRVEGPEQIAKRAGNYELQMQAYSIAAGDFLGSPIADASLYFLRPGEQYAFGADPASLQTAADRLAELTEQLIVARRTKNFKRIESPQCGYCQYSALCR
jgi:ATP-dependent helicase/nuclease subunit A